MALTSHASKVMLKVIQGRMERIIKELPPDIQGGFRRKSGTRDDIENLRWFMERERENNKRIYAFASFTTVRRLTVWTMRNSLTPSKNRISGTYHTHPAESIQQSVFSLQPLRRSDKKCKTSRWRHGSQNRL